MSKCTRCGKDRVVISSYTEEVNKSPVTYTVTVCPDPECQKIVDGHLRDDKVKKDAMLREKEEAAAQRALMKANSA